MKLSVCCLWGVPLLLLLGCPDSRPAPDAGVEKLKPHEGPYTLEHATEGLDETARLLARIETSTGTMVAELYQADAPQTVANFVGLARGVRPWQHPQSGEWVKRPFYDGLTFHRRTAGFAIQTGCPIGDGRGGPGYRFEDEFSKTRTHDRPGILSMANDGPLDRGTGAPGTNGSQFFITERPTPQLDGRHAVFGVLVSGLDVARRIARLPEDEVVVIEKLTITGTATRTEANDG